MKRQNHLYCHLRHTKLLATPRPRHTQLLPPSKIAQLFAPSTGRHCGCVVEVLIVVARLGGGRRGWGPEVLLGSYHVAFRLLRR